MINIQSLLNKTTTATTISIKQRSLRTQIPIDFIKMADIEKGDKLQWDIGIDSKTGSIVAKITKKQ